MLALVHEETSRRPAVCAVQTVKLGGGRPHSQTPRVIAPEEACERRLASLRLRDVVWVSRPRRSVPRNPGVRRFSQPCLASFFGEGVIDSGLRDKGGDADRIWLACASGRGTRLGARTTWLPRACAATTDVLSMEVHRELVSHVLHARTEMTARRRDAQG